MSLFDVYKTIYQKTELTEPITNGMLIVLNKWLSQQEDNLLVLRKLIPYLFYIEPTHYYYLLILNIPKKYRVPYLSKKVVVEETEPDLVNKIQYVMGWSNKELFHNKLILDKTILTDSQYWKEELGLC